MAKLKSKNISRIIEQASSLVYVVNMDNSIVFANQATIDWTGLTMEQLQTSLVVADPQHRQRTVGLSPPAELLSIDRFQSADESGLTGGAVFWIWKIRAGTSDTIFCPATAQLLFHQRQRVALLVTAQPNLESDILPAKPDSRIDVRNALAESRNQLPVRFTIDSLVGCSPFAERARQQARLAANCQANVLITGPTGSGKEHFARTLFDSRDQDQVQGDDAPLLTTIHCSIADPQLIQQAIADAKEFDHRRRDREVVLLLLDVDRLSPSTQAELNGFLELPNFPVRTFATAERSLVQLAGEKQFLPALGYRLSPFVIPMIPLCDRREDIPVLAQALLEQYLADPANPSAPGRRSRFSDRAVERLAEFDWPGNVNQLRDVVQAAAQRCTDAIISENDLPPSFFQSVDALRIGRPMQVSIDLDAYLASIEKELVVRAVRQARGNKTQAAKQLKVSRPKLLRRLQFFQLDEFLSPTTTNQDDQTIDASAFEELPE